MAAAEPPGAGALPQLVSSGLAPAGGLGLKRVGDAPRKARPGWVPPCQAPASYWGRLSGPPPARSGEAALEE